DDLLSEIDRFNQGAWAGLSRLFFVLPAGVAVFMWAAAIWGKELFREHRWPFNSALLGFGGIAVIASPWIVKELWNAAAQRRAKARRRALIGAFGSRQRAPVPVPPLAEGEARVDVLEQHVAALRAGIERHESFLEQERSRTSKALVERARLEALFNDETEARPTLLLERDLAKAAHDERLESVGEELPPERSRNR
ncbi:MAG: hypothetical protein ACYC8T_38105, partial [Myxococcaceae bacterium]